MKELSMEERVQLLVAPDSERLAYFVEQVKATELVWSLSNEEGFVMVETDDGDCVMVWPDAEFASQWAIEDWDDCEPVSVSLETFKTEWLPSLVADKITVAVFPNIEDEGKLSTAEELAALLA
ncbi:MAG: DUF2750 domain-containing protein [Gammaproteobacteria bacterium]|jgi:hypothetical protein|uniref:DUF2750 domain-containing protein n=1 Tax=Marinomonas polaris DSM 16579 TaxID=1122206 RepID=A0A1M4SNZ7_9GAMM|nr:MULTISPECIES: DUF2750 domain-containing protein [Marinomonas]MBU1297125.1 DUF2750 domain-containing protein [Gammaproteobacteria bacterium]MBU1465563.1 DUF2750 domain-containing protein [Gammaproteobacteria bacterium]MBU2413562.1 DUF2750 domain-containing protein [Gammaproteobacteria bacterium]SHE33908.1 Protein of unknown function [Marinomonas polaris DSM 16579]